MDSIISQAKEIGEYSSTKLFIAAIKSLCPNRKSIFRILIFTFIALAIAVSLALLNETNSKIIKVIELINSVDLVILGLVFTGYTLFQAILKKELLRTLLASDEDSNQTSTFVRVDRSFYYLMSLYFLNICLNILGLIFLIIVGGKWVLIPHNILLSNAFFVIISVPYLTYSLLVIWEIKFFIYNLSELFNLNIKQLMLNIIKESENEDK